MTWLGGNATLRGGPRDGRVMAIPQGLTSLHVPHPIDMATFGYCVYKPADSGFWDHACTDCPVEKSTWKQGDDV